MAKKTCNLNLEESTIEALDEAAEIFKMSRSEVADRMLSAVLGKASTEELVKTMFAAAIGSKKVTLAFESEVQPT